ncbi:MAG: hypothetical protein ACE366_05830 [Bradymonadia bacterium]
MNIFSLQTRLSSPRLRSALGVCVAALGFSALLAGTAAAQYPTPKIEDVATDASGLPPFLRAMKRQPLTVEAYIDVEGQRVPAPPGLPVSVTILAQGSKVKDYFDTTKEGGKVTFQGIPTNPKVQQFISYKVQVDYNGVRFPFMTKLLPQAGEGGALEVTLTEVTDDTSKLFLRHAFVEVKPLEDALLISHRVSLMNGGRKVVNLGNLPAGGLRLVVPEGAKHPEVHGPDGNKPPARMIEALGTSIWFKGAVMPGEDGAAQFVMYYTVPYGMADTFEWSMSAPIRTVGGYALVWRDKWEGKKARQRTSVPLGLDTRGIGAINPVTMGSGKRFWELSAQEAMLEADQPFQFAITGVPTKDYLNVTLMLSSIGGLALLVLFGFQRPKDLGDTTRLSRAHLETERDRLLRALARMRKAAQKGRISQARFEREQEAITARLVSLYKALDRLDGR